MLSKHKRMIKMVSAGIATRVLQSYGLVCFHSPASRTIARLFVSGMNIFETFVRLAISDSAIIVSYFCEFVEQWSRALSSYVRFWEDNLANGRGREHGLTALFGKTFGRKETKSGFTICVCLLPSPSVVTLRRHAPDVGAYQDECLIWHQATHGPCLESTPTSRRGFRCVRP